MPSSRPSTRWPPAVEAFLDRFVETVRQRLRPVGIVLFGSYARGDYRDDSDLDLLVVVDQAPTLPLIPVLSGILTDLRPPRDVTALPTNLRDMDASFLRNVFREGVVLHGKLLSTAEGIALQPRSLVTYDLSTLPPRRRVKISRWVHGHVSKFGRGRRRRTYSYPGLATRSGAVRISPSVFLVPGPGVLQFAEELRALGARVAVRDLYEGV